MLDKDLRRFLRRCKPVDKYFECENFMFEIDPQVDAVMFADKDTEYFGPNAFTFDKAAKTMQWYFDADRNDKSILKHVPFFKRAMNSKKPYFNSNYGHYFFTKGLLGACISELAENIHTRGATFMINTNQIIFSDDTDKLCTNSVSFRIRDNKLNMTVHMRSNHLLNMMPIDIFTFSIAYSIVFNELVLNRYTNLSVGTYTHFADSMHIDSWQMPFLQQLVSIGKVSVKTNFNFKSSNWNDKLQTMLNTSHYEVL